MGTGHDHTWFVLTQKIIEKEFALSGSEQNPDLTGQELKQVLTAALGVRRAGAGRGVQAARRGLRRRARRCRELVARDERADRRAAARPRAARARDRGARPRDRQPVHARTSRSPRSAAPAATCGDRLTRVAAPHRILDPDAGPADRREAPRSSPARRSAACRPTSPAACCSADGEPLPGLYAAGEVAGFGGGGMHGYRALEGTFLGGCLFSGRIAGRAAAAALAGVGVGSGIHDDPAPGDRSWSGRAGRDRALVGQRRPGRGAAPSHRHGQARIGLREAAESPRKGQEAQVIATNVEDVCLRRGGTGREEWALHAEAAGREMGAALVGGGEG